jgi:hypothetical protein
MLLFQYLEDYVTDWPMIKNYMYSSQCGATDKLCKSFLSGAL